MFIRSSVDEVKGGEFVVRKGGQFTTESRKGLGPNHPVNLDRTLTFYPDYAYFGDSVVELPTIIFRMTGGVIVKWYYPPTDEGTKLRDRDLKILRNGYCERINLEPKPPTGFVEPPAHSYPPGHPCATND